ncbi:hypothetical protein F2P45_13640 [Massilia sp. CCM 8733]|uniref:Uncharacterized protein n=1 Tax=Massilia mucilaginosa TaxID=2609282 RepID=A0ABX0NTF4_9BURK|nr:hypothetical protein [Massilia mucilaginosa]NHZ90049.1 hypothetical protein [Massilia mucilaginosa]
MPDAPTVAYAGKELFLVEGALASLHDAPSKTQLLDKLARRMRHPPLAAGEREAAAGMHRALTEETVMYDAGEEPTPVFIARLGGSLVYGMFEHACELAEGDRVRAVVARSGAHLHLHSLIREADQMMLLPSGAWSGARARVRGNRREMWRLIAGMWIVFALFMALLMYEKGGVVLAWGDVGFMLVVMALSAGLVRLGHGSPYQIMPGGDEAQAIFTVYGFPCPEYFDAAEGLTSFRGRTLGFSAPCARIALDRHKEKFDLY